MGAVVSQFFDGFDGGAVKEGKLFEKGDGGGVIGIEPELVEVPGVCFQWAEPNGTVGGFTEFLAIGAGEEGEGDGVCFVGGFTADEVGT